MALDQSNAFPDYSTFDIRPRVMGTNLPDDTLSAQKQTRQRTAKATTRHAGKATPGSDGTEVTTDSGEQRIKRRNGILKIAGISVGSVATITGAAHMNEVITLAKDWGPGTVVVVLAFLLLFNVPLQWSKYRNDQEDRSERKELFMAILNMQERTTEAISGLGTEVRANTGKIDQLILVLSSRACMIAVPQVHIQQQQPQAHPQSHPQSPLPIADQVVDQSEHDTPAGARRKRT